MTQINPPFDGSAPCPMCNQTIRGVSALIHNFLVRWPEPKSMLKLWDLRTFHERLPQPAAIEHPAVRELVEAAKALIEASDGMRQDGLDIHWSREIWAKVSALAPRLEAAIRATEPLSEEHFRDNRHATGELNYLRERQGSRGFLGRAVPNGDYHYTVEVVDAASGDLVHVPCNTGLKLHQHFLDELDRDPTFYGKIWCPTCGVNAAREQFLHHRQGPAS